MLKVGVMGVRGYTGEELLRLLLGHPDVEVCCVQSRVERPQKLSELLPAFAKKTDLVCKNHSPEEMAKGCDVVFLALPHTVSMGVAPRILAEGKKVIDLSADFRLKDTSVYERYYKTKHLHPGLLKNSVYGLPELYREKIKKSALVANPGCYPTSILLAAIPFLKRKKTSGAFFVADAKSGVTGAGRSSTGAFQFADVNESFKAYRVGEHQHVPEMEEILADALGEKMQVVFTPHLVPINRGILSTLYFPLSEKMTTGELVRVYSEFYRNESFVRVLPEGVFPEVKNVLYTNFCDVAVKVDEERNVAVVLSALDNLMKGASGQAVQNMNLLAGFTETKGLL
ncbi:MAG: N-acetyl-gamma-glutamyl-phosphate reductase [Candidatus Omnitrophica bacterium]|nr:N-acetyl-gamma-glutamyl-phosphate reductase [Candidatus Omnitrophota bacterium]